MPKIFKKQLILSLVLMVANAMQAQAGDDPAAQHAHHHHHHNSFIGDGQEEPGEGVYHRAIDEKEFLAKMPTEPGAALRYLFDEINSYEESVDKNTTMRLALDLVDDVPGRDPISIEPKLESKGQLTLQVRMSRSLENNSVAVHEILMRLGAMMTSEGIDLTVFKEVKGSYHTPKKYLYHPETKQFIGIDHKAGYHTIHYKTHHFQSVLHLLGASASYSSNIRNPLVWSELKINVENGSQLAARELAEFDLQTSRQIRDRMMKFKITAKAEEEGRILADIQRVAALRGLDLSAEASPSDAWIRYSEHIVAQKQTDLDRKTKLATLELRDMKKRAQAPEIKNRRDLLERQPEKLEALVKRNDREGVAQLLEAYVPWAELSPFEGALWSDWIKAIRKPNPNESIVLFRGIDNEDAIQVARDEKGKEIGYGFFSTLLTKNQGNYTRRLRSIQTMRSKFANFRQEVLSPLQETPKISAIMVNHAGSATGSPFMSFTTQSSMAHSWGTTGGVAIVNIDKRRILPNVNSPIKGELEMLVPLIVFPDEVIHFARPTDPGFKKGMKEALAVASQKLGREIPEDTIKEPADAFRGAYKVFGKAQRFLKANRSCKLSFSKDEK